MYRRKKNIRLNDSSYQSGPIKLPYLFIICNAYKQAWKISALTMDLWLFGSEQAKFNFLGVPPRLGSVNLIFVFHHTVIVGRGRIHIV